MKLTAKLNPLLKKIKNFWFIAFSLLFIAYFIMGHINIDKIGFSIDEYSHLGAAESYLEGYGLNPEHPLGQKIVNTIYFAIFEDGYTHTDPDFANMRYSRGMDILLNHEQGSKDVIYWSRMAYLVTNTVLVFTLIYLSFRLKWLDPKFSLLLSIFFVFSPTYFPHAVLANFDVAGSSSALAFSLFTFLSLRNIEKWIPERKWEIILVTNALFYWTLQTKFSNLVQIPVYFIWVFAVIVYTFNLQRKSFKPIIKSLLTGICLVILSISSIYAFAHRDGPRPKNNIDYKAVNSNYQNIQNTFSFLPELSKSQTKDMLNDFLTTTMPVSGYFDGAYRTFVRSDDDQPPYLFGEMTEYKFFDFFIRIYWFKETPIIVFLTLMTILYGLYQIIQYLNPKAQQKNLEQIKLGLKTVGQTLILRINKNNLPQVISLFSLTCLVFFPIIYSIVSSDSGLVIGYRHGYPIVIFLYALFAYVLLRISDSINYYKILKRFKIKSKNIPENLFNLPATLLAIFYIGFGLAGFSQDLSYISPIWQKEKWELVNESTINWGQEQKYMWAYFTEELGVTPDDDILIASRVYYLKPSPDKVSEIESNKPLTQANKYSSFPILTEELESYDDIDYFVADTETFQKFDRSTNPVAKKNWEYLKSLEPVYTHNGIVYIYKLK